MMLPVLWAFLAVETILAMLLISKIPPLEKLVCLVMDLTKTPKGSAVTKTLGGTLVILLMSSLSTYLTAQSHLLSMHASGEGHMHAIEAETFILRSSELESATTGFILLLAVMIDRTHYYLRGKRGLTVQLDVLKKQSKSAEAAYLKLKEESAQSTKTDESEAEIKSLREIIADLREKVGELQNDVQTKEKDAKNAEANAQAIRKQSEGMALEYERLLEDHENLRIQVSSFDRQHSRSSTKKDT